MVLNVRNVTNDIVTIRTGYDCKSSNKIKCSAWLEEYETNLMDLCDKYDIDPDMCECDIDDSGSVRKDARHMAKLAVRRTLRKLGMI